MTTETEPKVKHIVGLELTWISISWIIFIAVCHQVPVQANVTMVLPPGAEGNELGVNKGENFTLTCIGDVPMSWNYSSYTLPEGQTGSTKTQENKTISERYGPQFNRTLTVRDAYYLDTGNFTCYPSDGNQNSPGAQSIYVYVRDIDNLLFDTSAEGKGKPPVLELNGTVEETLVVPCRTTVSELNVTLVKDDEEVKATYDPHIGFTLDLKNNTHPGLYKCVGRCNKLVLQEMSYNITVFYYNFNAWTDWKNTGVLSRGSRLELVAQIRAWPDQAYAAYLERKWYDYTDKLIGYNDTLIPGNGPLYAIEGNDPSCSTLIIHNVSNSGKYYLVVSNGTKYVKVDFDLQVEEEETNVFYIVVLGVSISVSLIIAVVMFFFGKSLWLRVKAMMNVEIKMHPELEAQDNPDDIIRNDGWPNQPPENETSINPSDEESLLQRTDRVEAETERDGGHYPSLDDEVGDSSGCSSAPDSVVYSLDADTQVSSDSGTEADQLNSQMTSSLDKVFTDAGSPPTLHNRTPGSDSTNCGDREKPYVSVTLGLVKSTPDLNKMKSSPDKVFTDAGSPPTLHNRTPGSDSTNCGDRAKSYVSFSVALGLVKSTPNLIKVDRGYCLMGGGVPRGPVPSAASYVPCLPAPALALAPGESEPLPQFCRLRHPGYVPHT